MATFIKEDSAEKLGKEVQLSPKLTNLMINKSNYYGEIDPKLQGYKRAKKIASAAEKEQYNTKDEKFKDKNSGVTLNYNEVKRWANALKSLPKNSDAFDANGGEKAKEMVDDLVKQVRRNTQKVEMVPEVEKLVDDLKISNEPLKPSKIGNADVYVQESCKKIYIKESQLQKLYEDYRQLPIPFDNKYHTNSHGLTIPTKQDYQYYIDWLEEIGNYGEIQGDPSLDLNDMINKTWNENSESLINDILDNLMNNGDCDELIQWIGTKLEYAQKYSYNSEKYYKIDLDDVPSAIEDILWHEDVDEFYDLLTDKGREEADRLIKLNIRDRIYDLGFDYKPRVENGRMYVERVVRVPSITGYSEGDDIKYSNNYYASYPDYFEMLCNCYPTVGECWTWDKGAGDSYCANMGGGIDITLRGWVSLADINWEETLFVNGWSLNYEKEVRIQKGTKVEIDEIAIESGVDLDGKKYPLKSPIIVPV